MSGSRCVLGMYRRVAVSVWGARGVSVAPGSSRYADQALRLLYTGSALSCEKDKPDHAKQEEVVQDKAKEQPVKENLLNVIGGMKVEVGSKRRFQALKMNKSKGNNAGQVDNMESTSSMFQRASEESHTESSKPLSAELVAAASAVASSLPFDKKQVESELLQQLRKHEQETDTQRKGDGSISNLISDMKIGKHNTSPRTASWRSNQIQFDDDGRGYTHDRGVTHELSGVRRRGLYAGRRLNIFPVFATREQPTGTVMSPTLWDLELASQIAAASEQPPRNGFEEMIQWTKEGKLWTFPIDNEAGLEEEQKVEFHEHIFLDKYLEDFPKQGPIRHFMELVVCGLSKNPYISVKKKEEHIEWFRDYFHQKEDVLKECDVFLN
ncbi:small ribosomal subunit protein mS31 [Discoglossus pictus]